ncbi:MAG: carbamoyltransferase C-terminal domain-containing protein, partial [Nanoarchaeota archaeon]
YHHVLGEKDMNVLDSPFLGPDGLPEKKDGIIRMAESKGLFCTKLREKELLQRVAELIHDNKIIGWFQGRMEFGPRALGNRSILANPCNPDMKDILNKRIKKREEFRPFAPVVCSDDAEVLFDIDRPLQKPTDYMLMIYPIKEEIRNKIPSVVHLDGTGRLQTIERMMNPRYYDLIKEFGKISGIPVLINTSFNIRGQPIVCTAEEAIETFFKADLDYLVVGDQLVSR